MSRELTEIEHDGKPATQVATKWHIKVLDIIDDDVTLQIERPDGKQYEHIIHKNDNGLDLNYVLRVHKVEVPVETPIHRFLKKVRGT